MLKKGHIRLGGSERKITRRLCEDELGGRWVDPLGCVVNTKIKYEVKGEHVYVAPMGAKKYPVYVKRRDFTNMTGRGGRMSRVNTYLLG